MLQCAHYNRSDVEMFEIRIEAPSNQLENLQNQLNLLGAAAISFIDTHDQPIYEPKPDEIILWDQTTLIALFEDNNLEKPLTTYFEKQMAEGTISNFTIQMVENKDWVRASLDQFTPMSFGKRLWIVPSWHQAPEQNAVNILLDPGLAFGTGSHPTTRLCLEWLDEHICGGETVIDYGCGSGILAIAAIKLGATKAVGVDYDPQALIATRDNATLNQITEDKLPLFLPDHFSAISADILVANILAKPIIEFAAFFSTLVKPNGKIVLSGILQEQVRDVISAYEPYFFLSPITEQDGWVRVDGIKR